MLEDGDDCEVQMVPMALYESMVSRMSRLTAWVAVTTGATFAVLVATMAFLIVR